MSSVLLGPYKLKGYAHSLVTNDFLKLRVKLGAELLQMNLSSASIEKFEVSQRKKEKHVSSNDCGSNDVDLVQIFHDPKVGGGLMIHVYPAAARKLHDILEPGSDAFLMHESAFSGSGMSKQ